MGSFVVSARAFSDLLEIGRYSLAHWGRGQRDLYLEMLDKTLQQLAENPFLGKDCSDIREGYRKFNAGSHVIYYRHLSADTILIVRILHSRMEYKTHLS